MRTPKLLKWLLLFVVSCSTVLALSMGSALAHCDTESGPVAVDAREALANDKFETVAIWVGPEQHEALKAAFKEALSVYQLGGKARDLAEQYFMETAVRLHRAAEGFPYTGLEPAQPLPTDVAAAERALETGNLEPVMDLLTAGMKEKVRHLFEAARTAKKSKNESLAAGRQWADAYVKYVIYVHGLFKTIQAGPKHGVGENG